MDKSTSTFDHAFIVNLLDGNEDETIRLMDKINPDAVLKGVKNHRIVGVIGEKMTFLPESEIKSKLSKEYETNKMYQMQLASELCQIQNWFAGIDFLPLKGPVLSQFLYNDPTQRNSWDLDILIDYKDLDQCMEILLSKGYSLVTVFNTAKQKDALIKHYHHIEFYHETRGILIEIHWDLTDFKGLKVTLDDLIPQTTKITLGANHFRVLNVEYQFEYLTMHGTFHLFERLQWLYDLKTFLSTMDEQQIVSLILHSKKNQSYNFILLTFNLLNEFFALPLNDRIQLDMAKSPFVSVMTDLSRREIFFNSASIERSNWDVMLIKHKTQFYSVGFIGLMKSLFSRNVRPKNWQFFAFPDNIFVLNHIFSRFIWLTGKMVGKL